MAKPFNFSSLIFSFSPVLASLITGKMRLKLLLYFFSNPEASGHLRGLAEIFGESTNAVRVELNNFREAGLLTVNAVGQKVVYRVNDKNPFCLDLAKLVSKYLGVDQLVAEIEPMIEEIEGAYIIGDYAYGLDTGTIELVICGNLNHHKLESLIKRAESKINRKIVFQITSCFSPVKEAHLKLI